MVESIFTLGKQINNTPVPTLQTDIVIAVGMAIHLQSFIKMIGGQSIITC